MSSGAICACARRKAAAPLPGRSGGKSALFTVPLRRFGALFQSPLGNCNLPIPGFRFLKSAEISRFFGFLPRFLPKQHIS